jgi:hypothetical protein
MSWDQETKRRERRWRPVNLAGPLILITLGLVFLMANLGMLGTNPWRLLWQWWPLILVLVGLEIFIGVLGRWSYVLSALLGVLVVIGTLALVGYLLLVNPQFGIAPAITSNLVQPMGDVARAEVNLGLSFGSLKVSALPAGGTNLLEADFAGRGGEDADAPPVRRTYQETGGVAVLTLKSEGPRVSFGGSNWPEWNLRLSPGVPMNLKADTVMGTYDLNLRDLRVTDLTLNGVMCTQQVQLPASGQNLARISGVMSTCEITIPAGTAARIHRKGLAVITVDEGRFPRRGDVYESANFSTATDRVEIVIESVMSVVRVR